MLEGAWNKAFLKPRKVFYSLCVSMVRQKCYQTDIQGSLKNAFSRTLNFQKEYKIGYNTVRNFPSLPCETTCISLQYREHVKGKWLVFKVAWAQHSNKQQSGSSRGFPARNTGAGLTCRIFVNVQGTCLQLEKNSFNAETNIDRAIKPPEIISYLLLQLQIPSIERATVLFQDIQNTF